MLGGDAGVRDLNRASVAPRGNPDVDELVVAPAVAKMVGWLDFQELALHLERAGVEPQAHVQRATDRGLPLVHGPEHAGTAAEPLAQQLDLGPGPEHPLR